MLKHISRNAAPGLPWLIWTLSVSLLSLGCQGPALEGRSRDTAASPQLSSTAREAWRVQPDSRIQRLIDGNPASHMSDRLFGVTQDLRIAVYSWYFVHGAPPPDRETLYQAGLLWREPVGLDGQPIPVLDLEADALPPPGTIGVSWDQDGFTTTALNPDPTHIRPVFTYRNDWKKVIGDNPVLPGQPVSETYPEFLVQRADRLQHGLIGPDAGGLAPEIGGNVFLFATQQLSERRVLQMQTQVWNMITAYIDRHGALPTDWSALCQEQGWRFPNLQHWPANRYAPEHQAAFAVQVYRDGATLRFLLKPTLPAADVMVYQYQFIPAEGKFTGTYLDGGPDDEAGWTDLLRVVLPGETDTPGLVGGSADLGSHPGQPTTSQAGALSPAGRTNGE